MTMIDFLRAGCQGPPPDEIAQLGAILTREAQQPAIKSACGLLPHTRAMRRLGDPLDYAEHAPKPLGQHIDHAAATERHEALAEAARNRLVLAQPEMADALHIAADELLELLTFRAAQADNTLTPIRAVGILRHCLTVFLEAAERKLQ